MNIKTIRILKNTATVMVVLAMIFAFLIAGIRIFGVQVFGVLTGSMEPAYPTGSLIYVKKVDTEDLRVNDVITFSISPNVIATHRIVEIVPDEANPAIVRYRTKGDANNDVDASLVSANNIIGKAMFSIPRMGYFASYIQQPPGIYVAILVCGLMIAFVFYTDSLENKQKKAPPRKGANANVPRGRMQQRPNPRVQQRPAQARQMQRRPVQQGYMQERPYPQRRPSSQAGAYPRAQQRPYPPQRRPVQRNDAPYESEYLRQMGYHYENSYPGDDSYARPRQRTQNGYAQPRSGQNGRR